MNRRVGGRRDGKSASLLSSSSLVLVLVLEALGGSAGRQIGSWSQGASSRWMPGLSRNRERISDFGFRISDFGFRWALKVDR
jgi:hypothetical protein